MPDLTIPAERGALRAVVKKAEWRAAWDTAPGSMEIGATLPSTESQAIADLERLSRYPKRYVNFRLESRTVTEWKAEVPRG